MQYEEKQERRSSGDGAHVQEQWAVLSNVVNFYALLSPELLKKNSLEPVLAWTLWFKNASRCCVTCEPCHCPLGADSCLPGYQCL